LARRRIVLALTQTMRLLTTMLVLIALGCGSPVRAETPEEWVQLGARVHGGFGSFIPVGIRIGLDALQRLNAKPREVTVVYYDSDKAPCACIADGVAIATVASVGQRTLRIAAEKAPAGAMAVIVVRSKQSGAEVRYTIADEWLPKLIEMNKTFDPRGRYDAVMKAYGLFSVSPEK
jgi:formylmethanofuran dehydrogenase subunit E